MQYINSNIINNIILYYLSGKFLSKFIQSTNFGFRKIG